MNGTISCRISAITIPIVFLIHWVSSLQFSVLNCPVHVNEPCNTNLIHFNLYTRRKFVRALDPFRPQLPVDYKTVQNTLKIVIHGYGGPLIDISSTNVTRAYIRTGHNVVFVDWGYFGSVPCYPVTYLNLWHVAQCTAVLIVSLVGMGAVTPEQIHLVGFSLGAHIAGFTGNQLQQAMPSLKPGRITGLDPALPLFATLDVNAKLNPKNAHFVDVIHTSAGIFGKVEACGHLDFYVNGGTLQPSCYHRPNPPLCSHMTAGLYFSKTIYGSQTYYGRKCLNVFYYLLGLCEKTVKIPMGEWTEKRHRGTYFVTTAADEPFNVDTARDFIPSAWPLLSLP